MWLLSFSIQAVNEYMITLYVLRYIIKASKTNEGGNKQVNQAMNDGVIRTTGVNTGHWGSRRKNLVWLW